GLTLQFGSGASPVRVTLRDASGRMAVERMLTAPGRRTIALESNARPGLWTAHLQTAGGETDFSFVVLGSLPAHPRVLLSADRLGQLRTAPEFAPLRKQIHEQASAQAAKWKDAAGAGAEIARLPAGRTL